MSVITDKLYDLRYDSPLTPYLNVLPAALGTSILSTGGATVIKNLATLPISQNIAKTVIKTIKDNPKTAATTYIAGTLATSVAGREVLKDVGSTANKGPTQINNFIKGAADSYLDFKQGNIKEGFSELKNTAKDNPIATGTAIVVGGLTAGGLFYGINQSLNTYSNLKKSDGSKDQIKVELDDSFSKLVNNQDLENKNATNKNDVDIAKINADKKQAEMEYQIELFDYKLKDALKKNEKLTDDTKKTIGTYEIALEQKTKLLDTTQSQLMDTTNQLNVLKATQPKKKTTSKKKKVTKKKPVKKTKKKINKKKAKKKK
jgi:hypothetical protein